MRIHSGPRRVVAEKSHPSLPPAPRPATTLSHIDQALNDLIRIMGKVAAGDFSEKPVIEEGDDAMARFFVAFRFLVDDLEKAHRQRQSEIDRLRELDQMKTQFINLAAHELNTPLTPIGIQLHMLQRRDQKRLTPEQKAALSALERNVGRLRRSVRDLLDVARLQNRGLQIHPDPVDLSHLVRTLADDFRSTAEHKKIRFDTDIPGPIPMTVDEDRINQVLFNLLTNAYKFTPEGGRIRLSVHEDAEHVLVRVTDSGIGLDKDQMGRLFRPFSQVHAEAESPIEGTGLGLFICKGIIEAHQGRLWVDSGGKDHGARFTFLLPKTAPSGASRGDRAPGNAAGPTERLNRTAPTSAPDGGPPRLPARRPVRRSLARRLRH